jgi:hypothetical protein
LEEEEEEVRAGKVCVLVVFTEKASHSRFCQISLENWENLFIHMPWQSPSAFPSRKKINPRQHALPSD